MFNNDENTLNSEFHTQIPNQGHPKIWAIGGGKGGVGKSLVTANLAICLARKLGVEIPYLFIIKITSYERKKGKKFGDSKDES